MQKMTLAEALRGTDAPREITNDLVLAEVPYIGFDEAVHEGLLVIHASLADDIQSIFRAMVVERFVIEKVVPIVAYNWDDQASMADNNTSCFNYRLISGTDQPSNHGLGRAVDINPRVNPYFGRLGVEPAGATYDLSAKGAITATGVVVRIFKEHGWTWLGDRAEYPDYQHFQKDTKRKDFPWREA